MVVTALKNREVVAATYFDFARAFNSVLPSNILDSLQSIGVHGPIL
jgi:hypothetical protein